MDKYAANYFLLLIVFVLKIKNTNNNKTIKTNPTTIFYDGQNYYKSVKRNFFYFLTLLKYEKCPNV